MPMQMPNIFSWSIFVFAIAVILLADRFPDKMPFRPSKRIHYSLCLFTLVVGILIRLLRLTTLPSGPTAEEALVTVQAKSLLQTGGFFGIGSFTVQLPQWEGEMNGPLLSILTMPFIALFHINAITVRMPLAIVSCAALPAAYGVGEALAERRGARWMLIIVALSPIFSLTSRLTAAASLSLPLLIIALCFALHAIKHPMLALPACVCFGLLSWVEDLYFILSPLLIVVFSIFQLFRLHDKGRNGRILVLFSAAAVGLLICLPGIMTAYASRVNGDDLRFWFVTCPHLGNRYEAGGLLSEIMASRHPDKTLFTKLWAVLAGGLFQIVMHENISQSYFLPAGMTALWLFSLPFALLGLVSYLSFCTKGKLNAASKLITLLGVTTLMVELIWGSRGILDTGGTTSIWDYMQMFPYTAILTTIGLIRTERRSRAGFASAVTAYGLSFALLSIWLFGGGYARATNVSFPDFTAAAKRAGEIQAVRGIPVASTSRVHPHKAPEEAARMLFLYAADVDMRKAAENLDHYCEIIWPDSLEEPPENEISLVTVQEARGWYWEEEDWDYEVFGRYALIIPK